MCKFQIKSYCKINLFLNVIRKLPNGYHRLKSLVAFCNIYDLITINRIKGPKDKIVFLGKYKKKINNNINTISRLLRLLRKKNILKNQFFKIKVVKNIPHGSGLGGGSSNAGFLLNFLKFKMGIKINNKQTIKIASQIGSDVPLFLQNKYALFNGKNNKILRLNKKFNLDVLIVYPNVICSTQKIYLKNKKISVLPSKSYNYLKTRNKNEFINSLRKDKNDLEETVFKLHPNVKRLVNFIKEQNGCYFSRITGSGSACIGIFFDTKSAIYAQKMIKLKFPKYWSAISRTI